jgi:hypothetical protein
MSQQESTSDHLDTRVDAPHASDTSEAAAARKRKSRRATVVSGAIGSIPAPPTLSDSDEASHDQTPNLPGFRIEPPGGLPEIVVRHADEIAGFLAERLQEVERRELQVAEFERQVKEAETAARLWVAERDQELSARERALHIREDELSTQQASIAAAELALEQESASQRAALVEEAQQLERQRELLAEREAQLVEREAALAIAQERLSADRRHAEEQQRAREQQWQRHLVAQQEQQRRRTEHLHRHRASLDARERAIAEREQAISGSIATTNVDAVAAQASAAHEHRLALEHRYVATELWKKLVASRMHDDEALQQALVRTRQQLQSQFERERAALLDVQHAIASHVRTRTSRRRSGEPRPVATSLH